MLRIPFGPITRRCDGATRRDFLRVGGLSALGLPALLRAEARGEATSNGPGEVGDPRLPRRRAVAPRQLRPEARRPVRGPREVRDDRHEAAWRPVLRPDPPTGRAERQVRAGPLGRPRQRPPRDGHELGPLGPVRVGLRRLPGDRRGRGARAGLPRPDAAVFRGPAEPVVHLGAGQERLPRRPLRVVQDGRPERRELQGAGHQPRRRDARAGRAAGGRFRQSLDGLARQVESDDQLRTLDEFQRRALDLVLSPEARRAFDVAREDPRLRDRYGRTTLGQSCLLARRLVEAGVRFVTVNSGGWDHHAKIFESLDRRLPELDNAVVGAARRPRRPRPARRRPWWS